MLLAEGRRQRAAESPSSPRSERQKTLPLINTDDTDLKKLPKPGALPRMNTDDADLNNPSVGKNLAVTFSSGPALDCGGTKVLQFEVTAFGDRSRAHSPPELKAA